MHILISDDETCGYAITDDADSLWTDEAELENDYQAGELFNTYVENNDGSVTYAVGKTDDTDEILICGWVRIADGDERTEEELYSECLDNVYRAIQDWLFS